jgi:monovalent cation/proton antiporter MnhG/PhaG subunit
MLILIGNFFLILGLFFSLTTVVGLIRIHNAYNQIHIACINDVMAVPLILIGCAFHLLSYGEVIVALKLITMIIMIYITSPIFGYVMMKVLYFFKHNVVENE